MANGNQKIRTKSSSPYVRTGTTPGGTVFGGSTPQGVDPQLLIPSTPPPPIYARDIEAGQRAAEPMFGDRRNLSFAFQQAMKERGQRLERGLSPQEEARIRGGGQASLRALRAAQGASGLQGGTAISQQAQVLQGTEQTVAQESALARERALNEFESAVGRRLFGIQAGGLNAAQLALQQRGLQQGLAIASRPAPQPD